MKLTLFEIYRYKFPTREGLLVRLKNELGHEGVGEIAPLPGRSQETLDDALQFTKQIQERFLKQNFTQAHFPPSVLFGMEMAMTALLSPLTEDTPFKLTKLHHNKIKLADVPNPVEFCKERLGSITHIDLNRKWDLKKTIEFCSHFKQTDFAYIEDPVSNFADLEPFYDATGFPYAVDEYLSTRSLDQILPLRGLTHLIIKPTLFGGLSRCKIIQSFAPHKTCVFSSANETAIGLMHIARIGTTLNPHHPLGIDTDPLFPLFDPKGLILQKNTYHNIKLNWKDLQLL